MAAKKVKQRHRGRKPTGQPPKRTAGSQTTRIQVAAEPVFDPQPSWAARLPHVGDAKLIFGLAAILFVVIWRAVLLGQRTLIGGDTLYAVFPWAGSAGAHLARNGIMFDIVDTYMPWISLVGKAFRDGQMPLWNQYELSGMPLLGNFQSAVFSPFTLITLPFDPAHGMSVAMLVKLWVAGGGMALFLRTLGCRNFAAVVGGVIYATSSHLNVWLGDTVASVAALMPWAFAAVEWYAATGRRLALAAIALAVGLQFLAGFPESSAYLCCALALYTVARLGVRGRRAVQPAVAVAAAGILGILLAGIQIVPFAEFFSRSSSAAMRNGVGLHHLSPDELMSWLVPNMFGNPAIDHLNFGGRPPNYNESTGFVGVGALLLAPVGVWAQWRRGRAQAVALALIVVLAAGVVYGAITPIVGRLPLFSGATNQRLISLMCFGLAVFAGLGIDAIAQRGIAGEYRRGSRVALILGLVALVALVVAALIFVRQGAGVDTLLPHGPSGAIGFWLAVAALSLAAGAGFLVSSLLGGSRLPALGFACLALVEGALFAGPYNPRVPASEVPPHSAAMTWLQKHAGGYSMVALGPMANPNAPALYGLRDVRGYETVIDPRIYSYWSLADSQFHESPSIIFLYHPGVAWLAAAGVRYVMTIQGQELPGTQPVYRGEGVTIGLVPGARPFAYAASGVVTAGDRNTAASRLALNPLGPAVVEGCCAQASDASSTVNVERRDAGAVDLEVHAPRPTTVVVLQSYSPGWGAQVDGRSVPIRAANVLFQAVQVPAGKHTVTLRYAPSSVLLGGSLSLLGLVGLFLLVVPVKLPVHNPVASRHPDQARAGI